MKKQSSILISAIHKKYMSLKISIKIMLVYFVFMVFSISLSSFIYQKMYYNIISKKVSEISLQMLYSIKSNINSMIEDISHNSKMILSNENVQTILRNSESGNSIESQRDVNNYLTSVIDAVSNISSIYIFDNRGNKYGVKLSTNEFKLNNVEDSNWYKDVIDKKGYLILRLNAGESKKQDSDKNYISLIRLINDNKTQKQIGTLVININESNFVNCYKDVISKYGTNILLLDEENKKIVTKDDFFNSNLVDFSLKSLGTKKDNSLIKKSEGQEYIFSCLRIEEYNWKIISSIPFRDLSKESSQFSFVALGVIVVNGLLLFIGAIFVSRLITNPIKKLLKSMKGIENGEFKRVSIETGDDEIGKLRDGYNIMVCEIEKLIERVVDEQKIKRKAELNVLQAQIKPHFLYNTLDAMSYLALSGKCEQVYESLEALGSYYRTSLSKGSEVITIGEEIDIIKNYLTLQKLRYGNIFKDIYEVDENVYDYKILKLVLQPLVENALYHGIKPKGESGSIKVTAMLIEDSIIISIEDDGVGMTEEALTKVIKNNICNNNSSFGLRGTIERLQIYYGISDVYEIKSQKNVGTKVTITIPIGLKEKSVKNGC